MDKSVLRNVGLTDNEIEVYSSIIESGDSLASEIGQKINKNRTHTYDIIKNLVNKGLVSYVIKNNRKYFSAANPEKLLDIMEERKKVISEQEKKIKEIIPLLLSTRKQEENETKVELYYGKEGIKTIYGDILKKTKEYCVLGGTGKISEILNYYFPHHENERVKKKIFIRILFNKELEGKDISSKRKYSEIRFLRNDFSSPIPTLIYKNKVVIIVWTEPLAIVIENKEISKTYKRYFDLLWEENVK